MVILLGPGTGGRSFGARSAGCTKRSRTAALAPDAACISRALPVLSSTGSRCRRFRSGATSPHLFLNDFSERKALGLSEVLDSG
jgi:hypothetical protein